MQSININNLSTAELLSLKEEVLDELTCRLECHMEDYLGERDWYAETGDPSSYEEVAAEIIDWGQWRGPGKYDFYTYNPGTPLRNNLFSQKVETPEGLAEALYEACVMAHSEGVDLARVGRSISCTN